MSTESSTSASTGASGSHAVAAAVLGAVVTVVLYWITLALAGDPIVTSSGASITIIISALATGYFAATDARRSAEALSTRVVPRLVFIESTSSSAAVLRAPLSSANRSSRREVSYIAVVAGTCRHRGGIDRV